MPRPGTSASRLSRLHWGRYDAGQNSPPARARQALHVWSTWLVSFMSSQGEEKSLLLGHEPVVGGLVHEIGEFTLVLELHLHEPGAAFGLAVDERRIAFEFLVHFD